MRRSAAGPEARWASASAVADGIKDVGVEATVRFYFQAVFPATVLAALCAGMALAASGAVSAVGIHLSGLTLGLYLAAVGVLAVGVLYGWLRIMPKVQPLRALVTSELGPAAARHVRRQILGIEAVDPAALGVLRGAAAQMRERTARRLVTTPGLSLYFAALAVDGDPWRVSNTLSLLLFVATIPLGVQAFRQFSRTGKFLRETA